MSSRSKLLRLLDEMQAKRIVVYGDLVADRFIYGVPKRISREAPVLILRQEREDLILGGGGNAISNIRSLGGIPVPVSMVGNDVVGAGLTRTLEELSIETSGISRIDSYRTPTKTRVLAGMPHAARQQIVRFDQEDQLEVDDRIVEALRESLTGSLDQSDGVLISDYGYGAVSKELVAMINSRSGARPVTLDSRYDLLAYPGVTAATPNEEEAEAAAETKLFGPNEDQILNEVGHSLRAKLQSPALLITRGSRGMALFEEGKEPLLIPVHGTDQIADVTGAGDTVIATFTLALAAGAGFADAARLANYAGAVVVMKMGTATASMEEIAELVRKDETLD